VVVAVIIDGLMAMVGVVGLFGAELGKWFDDRLVQQLGALGAGVYRHVGSPCSSQTLQEIRKRFPACVAHFLCAL
jgi:hypothetical protein